jgi:hypothetical protein
LIAIGVETECRSIGRSLSRRGPKGEPDALITTESEVTDLLRRLIAIEIESEYRSVARSLSICGPKGGSESASKPLVDFGVLNDNLIK